MRSAIVGAALVALASLPLTGSSLANTQPSSSSDEERITERSCGTEIVTIEQQNSIEAAVLDWVTENGDMAVGGQIKVAWHVIYSGSTGNIPQSQIDAQIAYLNSSYSATGYTFVLASVDRTNNNRWWKMTPGSGAETQAKNALAISPSTRLNIYSCKPGQNLLGWATFPWSYSQSDKRHGVVIHYGSVPGGYLSPYNLGGTAAHEVGHYLGLYHTFQGGCAGNGDFVADTPPEATPTSGCPSGKDTCAGGGLDPIHNYMDYSTDACYTEFTAGQDARMDVMVPQYRPSLLNAPATEPGSPVHDASLSRSSDQLAIEVTLRAAPNPFRGTTGLEFSLPRESSVELSLFNAGGQAVRTIERGRVAAGSHVRTLDASGLAAGVYLVALRVDGVTASSRPIVVQR